MASGLAVVAFRHAAAAELIDHDRSGLVLPPGDEAAFCAAATELSQQPVRYARLGRAARQRALEWRWPAIADTFLAILEHARESFDETTRSCRL